MPRIIAIALETVRSLMFSLPLVSRAVMLGAAAVATLTLYALFGDSLHTLEEDLGTLGWTLQPEEAAEQRIVIVAIDDRSIAREGWPFPEESMAQLVTTLAQAGVRQQLHDIVYTTAQPALIAALASAQGTVLGQLPILDNAQNVSRGALTHSLTGVSCGPEIPVAGSFVGRHRQFASIPAGHTATTVAPNGAVHQLPALVCVDGSAYPALAISGFLQAVDNAWSVSLTEGQGLFAPDRELLLDAYPGLRIPLDADGHMRISYRNLPQTYSTVSAIDVLDGAVEPAQLENTWVLIGSTAAGIGDRVPTPYSGATAGVELQARVLGSLLDAGVPYTPRSAEVLLLLLSGAAAIVLLLASGRRSLYGLPVAAIALPLGALMLHGVLLSATNVWLGWLLPALFSLCAASLLMLLEYVRAGHERSITQASLSAYVSGDLAEIAGGAPGALITRRGEATLLSADLRNFSAFSESRPPEESAVLLHAFFVRVCEIVELQGGRVHEYKGDGLLAIWDDHSALSAVRALQAARAMQDAVDNEILPQHALGEVESLALGIAIEQGPVLSGSIGPAHRRARSMLGDTVTIVLRIQEMTEELALPILIGECAARQLGDYGLESQGSYMLSGLSVPHTLFAPPLNDSPTRRRHGRVGLTVISGGRA